MKANNPLYLTQSRCQIWYYQRWTPIHFRKNNPQLKKIFRLSLQTTNLSKAKVKSRLLSVKIDELALRYFDNPKDFAQGMELLYEYAVKQSNNNFEQSGLYDYEDLPILEINEHTIEADNYFRASALNSEIQEQLNKQQDEIEFLKKTLLNNDGNSKNYNKKLLAEFYNIVNPPISEKENPLLNDVFDKWKQDKENSIEKAGFHGYLTEIDFFIRVINDCHHKKIRIIDMKHSCILNYIDIYKKLPKGTKTKGKKISEIKRLSGELKSNKTIKDTFGRIKTFLTYIGHKGYKLDSRVLNTISGAIVEIKIGQDENDRIPYTDDDLTKLFNSEKYTKSGDFKKYKSMYWVPLLGLFTGARMSEIIQLQKPDIKKDDQTGIWIIEFNSNKNEFDKEKRLKEKGSYRIVPIHDKLIKLGFLDFLDSVKDVLFIYSKNDIDGEKRDKKGKFSNFSKRFKTYRKQVGVLSANDDELKDFHSFRHNVRDSLSELGKTGKDETRIPEGIIDNIVGHASGNRSEGEKKYTHALLIEIKKKAIDQLEYKSIDFDKILPWYNCDPWRKNKRDAIQNKRTKK